MRAIAAAILLLGLMIFVKSTPAQAQGLMPVIGPGSSWHVQPKKASDYSARKKRKKARRAHVRAPQRAVHQRTWNIFTRYEQAGGGMSSMRSCLTAETRGVLNRMEERFGAVKVISTCRPGATIAGSGGRPSYHRYGMAVDFKVPKGVSKSEVVRWLFANNRGVVMTYRKMGHVHFDTGSYHKIACGGCGSRNVRHRVAAVR